VFTGIVEETGEVLALERRGDSAVLRLRARTVAEDIRHGASVAVDGVCLTVTGWTGRPDGTEIGFDVMGETLQRTALGELRPGDAVNLERAARVDSRLDGHVVQGHIDGTGLIVSRPPGENENWDTVRFGLPRDLARFVAEKGSIAVSGVSLTVTAVGTDPQKEDWFEVGLIPETLKATTLGALPVGAAVNLEVDVLAKYVARLLEASGR
jgi:riboflavin synthase